MQKREKKGKEWRGDQWLSPAFFSVQRSDKTVHQSAMRKRHDVKSKRQNTVRKKYDAAI
jgi:hypothetical protein